MDGLGNADGRWLWDHPSTTCDLQVRSKPQVPPTLEGKRVWKGAKTGSWHRPGAFPAQHSRRRNNENLWVRRNNENSWVLWSLYS